MSYTAAPSDGRYGHDERSCRGALEQAHAAAGSPEKGLELSAPTPGRPNHVVAASSDGGRPAVAMRGIFKRFGPVQALADAVFEAGRGEIHALLGENGAGKTTIMNVLAGLYRADAGEIRIDGALVVIRSPRDAADLRIGMVHQHFELVGVFSGLDNILLAAESGLLRSQRRSHREAIERLASEAGLEVDLDTPVNRLPVGDQQKVEILKALYAGTDILVLDEPTTHLTPAEVDTLFGVVRQLAAKGITVILISHKLSEVLAVCQRITVLRKGATVGTVDRADADREVLVAMLMGGAPVPLSRPQGLQGASERRPLLALDQVRTPDDAVQLDLTVYRGELLGVAGVAGNGQQALVDLISGIATPVAGSIFLAGEDITALAVAERIRRGIAVLPEDRLREAVLPGAPVHETFFLGMHQLGTGGRFQRRRMRELTRAAIDTYRVVAQDEDAVTATLSGGNIQKLLVARAETVAMSTPDGVVVAMNPSRGLDVGAAAFVHSRFLDLREAGRAVLFVSEDLDELMEICDRIVVLRGGVVVGELDRDAFDRQNIGALMVDAHG